MFFESIKIMFLGMGTVFLFLAIMVYVTKIMSKIIQKYFPDTPKTVDPVRTVPIQCNNDKAKVAALIAAMFHHEVTKTGNQNG